jgi:hypothetical protein
VQFLLETIIDKYILARFNIFYNITGALQLPYTSLLEPPEAKAVHVKKTDIPDLEEDGYHIFSYYPKNQDRNFEMYQIEMDSVCI